MSTDNKHIGTLQAVVIDPRDDEVTHIVVNAGPHFPAPGFGAPKLISVPIEEMADAREEEIILKCTKRKFMAMPLYADWSFAGPPPRWQAPEGLRRDGAVMNIELVRRSMGGWSIPVPWEDRHRENFEREIPRDSHVWRVEPHIHIGEVDRVLTDEVTENVKAVVIRRGHLFGHDVILPIEYVVDVQDNVIHVQMTDAEIESLEKFEAPPEP